MTARKAAKSASESLADQLDREKRAVSYDMYDMTVRQLVDMVEAKEIEIAPEYQRHFVWDIDRESELIESIYLGIPVPSLYMAANPNGTWEVVDGVQRLSTLVHFCGNSKCLPLIDRKSALIIANLTKLTNLNGANFMALPKSLQLNFLLRPVRVTTLNDKSDFNVRYDLFERLNTGGVKLHAQEIRNCVFRGEFRDLIKKLATDPNFLRVVKLPDNEQQHAIYEECVLRFFAFLENYRNFDHSVLEFLNGFMIAKNAEPLEASRVRLFRRTMEWIAEEVPTGITRGNRNTTPLNLFEAIAVGVGLAIQRKKTLKTEALQEIMYSDELRSLTTGATNSKNMVVGRIEFVLNKIIQ
jgi:hypothetical protein